MDASGSTDPDCEIVEYRWDYGGDDAIDETMAGPLLEMQFISPGEVEISVTVVDDDGNTDTATGTMTVVQAENQHPSADIAYSPTHPAVGDTVSFDASESSDPDGSVGELRWDFDGDGTVDQTTSSPTVEYTYTEACEVTPTVTVVDNEGATATTSFPVTIESADSPPEARLDLPDKVTTEELITMDASGSTDPDGEIVEYRWDYGGDDAIDETMPSPELDMQFTVPGEIEISVTVVDDDGNTDTATETMTVVQANSTSDSRNPGITL
jgi:PKD repeat protein